MAARLGVHAHTYISNLQDLANDISAKGAKSIRLDSNWSSYQSEPRIIDGSYYFITNPPSNSFEYQQHLEARGHGTGASLDFLYQQFRSARDLDLEAIFNFGVVPSWAKVNGTGDDRNVENPNLPGQFLFDLILHIARQPDGISVLQNIEGWQLFNEVNNTFGSNGDYTYYFQNMVSTNHWVQQAYNTIGWNSGELGDPPAVLAPTLGGGYLPQFWDQFFEYDTANGGVLSQIVSQNGITIHPYHSDVRDWQDPFTGEGNFGFTDTSNFAHFKIMLPTDDYLTWFALTNRQNAETFGIRLFEESGGNRADRWFDFSTEVGTEQTIARLYQNGIDNVDVNFTEWGGASWTGGRGADTLLYDTIIADPYKYDYYSHQQTLPLNVAYNLQAEAIVQTLGLIEDWDFVETATAYEYVDQEGNGTDQDHFGLYNRAGILKPAGELFFAYTSGQRFEYFGPGVNIFIRAEGQTGEDLTLNAEDELLLTRGGNDTVNAGSGDDIIFGGSGNDTLNGQNGFDRLFGGQGDDRLSGGAGWDKLKGGSGNDILTGGSGRDQFAFAVFSSNGSGYSGNDTITDFNVFEDVIAITGGYSFNTLRNTPDLLQDTNNGVSITLGDNGATVTLNGVSSSQLSANNFYVVQADTTVSTNPPPPPPPPPSPGGDNIINDISGQTQHVSNTSQRDVFVINGNSSDYTWGLTEDGVTGTVVFRTDGTAPHDILNSVDGKFEIIRFSDREVDLNQEPTSPSNPPPNNNNIINDISGQTQHVSNTSQRDVFVINGNSSDYTWGLTEDGVTGTVVFRTDGTAPHDILNSVDGKFEIIRFSDREVDLNQEPTSPSNPPPNNNNIINDISGQTQHVSNTSQRDVFVINGNSSDYTWGLTEDGVTGTVVFRTDGTAPHDILNSVDGKFEIIRFSDREVDLNQEPTSPSTPPPPSANQIFDNPNENQSVFATDQTDVFVINGDSGDYGWAPTQDGTSGYVVWKTNPNDGSFDLLYHGDFQFEQIQFNNRTVTLATEPNSPTPPPPSVGNEIFDNPNENQSVFATNDDDVFVINGVSSDYAWGRTEDQTSGYIVYKTNPNDGSFDLLYETNGTFESIRFNDQTVNLAEQTASRQTAFGTNTSDTMQGSVGIDSFYGGSGTDTLYGGLADDRAGPMISDHMLRWIDL